MNTSASPFLDLSIVLRGLRGAVGVWCARGLVGQALAVLLYARLSGIFVKIERLVARFEAGRLWRLAPRVLVAGVAGGARHARRDGQIWPGRFGWLVRLASWQAAGFGLQLRAVLEAPEMIALLVACPQARRALRPVCRMLAIETSLLRPGVVGSEPLPCAGASAAEVADVVRTRVRTPRVPVDFGRIPLPRGVLSAARRLGFGRVR